MSLTEQAVSAENLTRFGIDSKAIHLYGCPAVEYVSNLDVGLHFDPRRLGKEFKRPIDIAPGEKYLLVIAHPDTTNKHDVNMDAVLEAVDRSGAKALIFYPNVDAHNSEIVSGIARYTKNERFYMIRHMPLEGFVHAMAHAACMIGNSSAGIREAASFGTPVINIGYRQIDRERNPNVIDIGDDYSQLDALIAKYTAERFPKQNLYLRPDCANRIAAEITSFVHSRPREIA